MYLGKNINTANESKREPAVVTLADKLLAAAFAKQDTHVIIEPREFLFSSDPGITVTALLKIEVTEEKFIVTEKKTEPPQSGTVTNNLDHLVMFALHFGMLQQNTVMDSAEFGCKKIFGNNLF